MPTDFKTLGNQDILEPQNSKTFDIHPPFQTDQDDLQPISLYKENACVPEEGTL